MNHFENTGFSVFRNSSKEFKKLCEKASSEVILFASGEIKTHAKWKSKDGFLKQSISAHKKSRTFLEIIRSDEILSIIKNIFKEKPVYISHSKISYKFNSNQIWLPHQDSVYRQDKTIKGITVCVFLDKILKKNGAITCYPSSHKGGNVKHELTFCENEDEPQILAMGFEAYSKEVIEGEIGDILYFDFNTIHSSEGNFAEGIRPLFIFDIQEIINIPLEENGVKAITFNYSYPGEGRIFFRRVEKFIRNVLVFPIAKKILFWANNLGILPKIKL